MQLLPILNGTYKGGGWLPSWTATILQVKLLPVGDWGVCWAEFQDVDPASIKHVYNSKPGWCATWWWYSHASAALVPPWC